MALSEKWRIAQRGAIPKSIIFRGHRYKLDGKYPSLARAQHHMDCIKIDRKRFNKGLKHDRLPGVSFTVKRVADGRGRTWYAVYKRNK
jgi:hypothetical protein